VNPANGQEIPIWIADYVMMSYGTGAIMAVPGHDERDHAFAKKFGLKIIEVVSGGKESVETQAFTENETGVAVNSEFLNGLKVPDAKEKMITWLESKGLGERKVQYKLRDWLFSRQRYWGEPFPMVHLENGEVVPLSESDLPVELPPIDEYKPTSDGKPPLARAGDAWLQARLKDGRQGTRETNTMPQWAGSCWYYLRFLDARNKNEAWAKDLEKYWMPVDLYVGGIEHAVLHLLYSRFWHKVLYDAGYVTTKEPFQKLFNQGMILAYSYQNQAGKYFSPDDARAEGAKFFHRETGEELFSQVEKMSKSKLNVVNPEEVIDRFGADSLRLYEMFMGPLDQVKPWKTDGVEGLHRFLGRSWRLVVDEMSGGLSQKLSDDAAATAPDLQKSLHRTIKKVGEDIEGMRFNTAIAQMMIFVNEATGVEKLPRAIVKDYLRVLSPYAPHLAEELWERLGEKSFLVSEPWPVFDPKLATENTVMIMVSVNGKKRDEFAIEKGAAEAEIEARARALPKISQALEGKEVRKVIVVVDRLINFVV
jgi:leucyl-tRNA synthetase